MRSRGPPSIFGVSDAPVAPLEANVWICENSSQVQQMLASPFTLLPREFRTDARHHQSLCTQRAEPAARCD